MVQVASVSILESLFLIQERKGEILFNNLILFYKSGGNWVGVPSYKGFYWEESNRTTV